MIKASGGHLTSLFRADSEKGREIGQGFQQFFELRKFLDLPEDKKEEIARLCIEVMRKLGKVANAVDGYHQIEEKEKERLLREAKEAKSSSHITHASHSLELEGKIEEVLTQAKSSLDVAVKILNPLFGINLSTFGKAGENVVNSLERQVPSGLQGRVKPLRQIIIGCKPWLEVLKYARDRQHFENIKVSSMKVALTNDKPHIELPNVSGNQLVKDFVEIIYNNVFCLLQDFLIISLAAKFHGGLAVTVEGVGRKRVFRVIIEPGAIRE